MRGRVTSERMFDACQHVAYLSRIRITNGWFSRGIEEDILNLSLDRI